VPKEILKHYNKTNEAANKHGIVKTEENYEQIQNMGPLVKRADMFHYTKELLTVPSHTLLRCCCWLSWQIAGRHARTGNTIIAITYKRLHVKEHSGPRDVSIRGP
jgi:hypothetical protein